MPHSTKRQYLVRSHRSLQPLLLSAALEEAGAPKIILYGIGLVGALVTVLFVWAMLTKIPEVASASGEVIPKGTVPVVQHPEGGVIAHVYAEDGQLVEQGDPILAFSPTQTLTELKQLKNKQTALKIDLVRTEAFIEGHELDLHRLTSLVPKPDEMADDDYAKLIENAVSLLAHQSVAMEQEISMLTQQINQYKGDIVNLRKQVGHIKGRKLDLAEQVNIHRKGNELQTSSKLQWLQAKDKLSQVETDFLEATASIESNESQLSEAQNKLTSASAKKLEQAYTERAKLNQQLIDVKNALIAAQEKADRLTVTAPVKGRIKGLDLATGSVIQPGGILFELVPINEPLVVEARVKPQDIGHIKIGASAHIKVSSYNFSRYGDIPGEIEKISASTFLDDKYQPYYKVIIGLERNYVGKQQGNQIMPGMTVTADITTGKKSLISYMLKPMKTTLSESFRER